MPMEKNNYFISKQRLENELLEKAQIKAPSCQNKYTQVKSTSEN